MSCANLAAQVPDRWGNQAAYRRRQGRACTLPPELWRACAVPNGALQHILIDGATTSANGTAIYTYDDKSLRMANVRSVYAGVCAELLSQPRSRC